MKSCTKCKSSKSLDEFPKDHRATDGKASQCKTCTREKNKKFYSLNKEKIQARNLNWRSANQEIYRASVRARNKRKPEQSRAHKLKTKYGLTQAEFHNMVASQDGRCAICTKTPETILAIDHCHVTGKVRGLLCRKCNAGIGLMSDNPDTIEAAARYLRRTSVAS